MNSRSDTVRDRIAGVKVQPDVKEHPERRKIRVISRAVSIIRVLSEHRKGLTLGGIAKLVGLPRSTVQRIVDALNDERFVIATSARGGIRLGPALLSIAAVTKIEIVESAHPTLVKLARETGETVDLSILNQNKVIFVDQVQGTHLLRASSAVGVSFPLHSSSAGKAMMAALSDAQLNKLRKRITYTELTKYTLRTWDELNREIQEARKQGVAFDREETTIGISSVGAVLRLPGGTLAAVAIPTPTSRFNLFEKALTKTLLEHCETLQSAIDRMYIDSEPNPQTR